MEKEYQYFCDTTAFLLKSQPMGTGDGGGVRALLMKYNNISSSYFRIILFFGW
jgi:hypothetical protein